MRERIARAHPHWLPAPVMLRALKSRGYTGSLSLLKLFYALLKPPRPAQAGPAVRFETEPGKQMQVDFVVLRRGKAPLSAFVATLGYSRLSFVIL